MNDPLGLQSAVMGMLSLSQGQEIGQSQIQSNGTFIGNVGQQQQTPMPLTPPGSPPEEGLVQGVKPEIAPKDVAQLAYQQQTLAQTQQYPCTSGQIANNYTQNALNFLKTPDIFTNPILNAGLQAPGMAYNKRSRSEKKPIPDEQKDDKYFERRRRNNNAAKKSRDCRKMREEDVSAKAAYLERENTTLRTQLALLKEQSDQLRALLIQKRQNRMQMQMGSQQMQLQMPNQYSTALG